MCVIQSSFMLFACRKNKIRFILLNQAYNICIQNEEKDYSEHSFIPTNVFTKLIYRLNLKCTKIIAIIIYKLF